MAWLLGPLAGLQNLGPEVRTLYLLSGPGHFNTILVFSDLWMAWCVFLGLCPVYVLISNPLHRYTVCIPPEFRAQLANAPLSHVQIKTSEIGVISF